VTLVMFHAEQNALRFFDCDWECWEDMKNIYVGKVYTKRHTSITLLMSWGWEVIGEL
jgi:hypothetical protein